MGTPLKERSAKWLLKKITQSNLYTEWLDAKAKLDYQSDDFSISATALIRMKKDSAIWVVGKKFGIEGIRALITPDSVYILNRLNKTYQIEGISFLQKQFSLPLDFYDLQNILLGNAVLLPEPSQLHSQIDSSRYLLQLKDEKGAVKSYTFDGKHFYLLEMIIKEREKRRHAYLAFEDHQALNDNHYFSYFRALQFRSPETGNISIDLKFTKVEFNRPKRLSFEIPAHYSKIP